MQISTGIDEPWDQKPMRFQDCVGRRYPVPLEVCSTFEASLFTYYWAIFLGSQGFHAFLKFAFHKKKGFSAVSNKRMLFFTPSGSDSQHYHIITKSDWKHVIRPAMPLVMAFYRIRHKSGSSKLKTNTQMISYSNIGMSESMKKMCPVFSKPILRQKSGCYFADGRSMHEDEIENSMMLWDWIDYITGVESRDIQPISATEGSGLYAENKFETIDGSRRASYEEWPPVCRGPYVRLPIVRQILVRTF
jgi:hypothetical protein